MYQIRKWLKILILKKSFLFVAFFSLFFRKKKIDFLNSKLKVGILFLKPLGFGDLIMLSPVIKILEKIFKNSEIYLITWIPEIIQFEKIKLISKKNAQKEKFDLLISPTLNLHHLFYIFKAKYWLGYFGGTKVQSNFSFEKYRYNSRSEHFLMRGVGIISNFDEKEGEKFEGEIKRKSVLYPELELEEPEIFQKLKNKKYLVLAPFSNYEERWWPFSYFSKVIRGLLEKKVIEKVIIVGGKADWEKEKLKSFWGNFREKEKNYFLDLVGKINLKELSFLIKNSSLYLGLDSGPAHLAYALSPKSAVVFVSVDPLSRKPLVENPNRNIVCFRPQNYPNFPPYSGLYRPDFKKCQNYALTISPEKVLYEILNLF